MTFGEDLYNFLTVKKPPRLEVAWSWALRGGCLPQCIEMRWKRPQPEAAYLHQSLDQALQNLLPAASTQRSCHPSRCLAGSWQEGTDSCFSIIISPPLTTCWSSFSEDTLGRRMHLQQQKHQEEHLLPESQRCSKIKCRFLLTLACT